VVAVPTASPAPTPDAPAALVPGAAAFAAVATALCGFIILKLIL